MNIKDQLAKDHSLENTLTICNYIGDNPDQFKELFKLYSGKDTAIAQRAAWVLSHLHDRYPALTDPYIEDIIKVLSKWTGHPAIKRNGLRVLVDKTIPEDSLGVCADICFDFLTSKDEPIAVKVHSMKILKGIVLRIPELKSELLFAIEEQYPFQSKGFQSIARKVLKSISSL